MKKEFWKFVTEDYIPRLINKHIYKSNQFACMIFPLSEKIPDYDKNAETVSIAAFLPLDKENSKQLDWLISYRPKLICKPHSEYVYGLILIDPNMIKVKIEVESYKGLTHLESVKETILHECRHSQQFGAILKYTNNDIEFATKVFQYEKVLELLEIDAKIYSDIFIYNNLERIYGVDFLARFAIDAYKGGQIENEFKV